MRFSGALGKLLVENNVLKTIGFFLSVVIVTLGITVLRLGMRPPLIIERSCYTKARLTTSTKHTPEEIETFVKDVLSQRFDSDRTPIASYLASSEVASRASEQRELENRKMRQRVLVNHVTVNQDTVSIDADRLISVGEVRSAFVFPLQAKVQTVARSESNPYGLTLLSISQAEVKDSK